MDGWFIACIIMFALFIVCLIWIGVTIEFDVEGGSFAAILAFIFSSLGTLFFIIGGVVWIVNKFTN